MTIVNVLYNEHIVHSWHDGERYGSWEESYDFDIKAVSVTSEPYLDIEQFDLDVSVGDTVYVVWMQYSFGDSFGRGDGKGEIVWAFSDKKCAEDCLARMEKSQDSYSIQFETDDGESITFGNPGAGYFESVMHFSLDSFIVQE